MNRPDTVTVDPAAVAEQAADRVAERAGVRLAELHDMAELRSAHELSARIWGSLPTNPPITAELGKAIGHAGGYLSGAWEVGSAGGPDRLVGVCVGFRGRHASLHSHLCGVDRDARGRDIGHALKLHQRAWALAEGLTEVTWTFDPLVRRNAYFNLAKLGAVPQAYLLDFYGVMVDALNAGDEHSDRLLVSWPLTDARVVAAAAGNPLEVDVAALRADGATVALDADEHGRPVPGDASAAVVLVRVPDDIAAVRAADPAAASAWRAATRQLFGHLFDAGGAVAGFHRDGWYVLARKEGGS